MKENQKTGSKRYNKAKGGWERDQSEAGGNEAGGGAVGEGGLCEAGNTEQRPGDV